MFQVRFSYVDLGILLLVMATAGAVGTVYVHRLQQENDVLRQQLQQERNMRGTGSLRTPED
jgi:hypothetical protein